MKIYIHKNRTQPQSSKYIDLLFRVQFYFEYAFFFIIIVKKIKTPDSDLAGYPEDIFAGYRVSGK